MHDQVAGSPCLFRVIAGGAFACRCGCAGVPRLPECAGPAPSWSSSGLAAGRQVMAGSAVSRCQQVVNEVAQGQVRSMRSQRRRAWSASRAGRW